MSGSVAREVAGQEHSVRLPHSATRRGGVTYARLLEAVMPDRTWGGWKFEGRVLRPGALVPLIEIEERGLLLECAGAGLGGRGHVRAPVLYVLWRYDTATGNWREVARAASVNHDWTIDLGPIARRELAPDRPILMDPMASAARVVEVLERELEPLEFKARVLVVRAVEDRLAAGMAQTA